MNADDLGFSRRVSLATMSCFDAGAITSATAMMWMRDSHRALAAARDANLPVGLHLNLTVELGAASVPGPVAARHRTLVQAFAPGARNEFSQLTDRTRLLVRDAVGDQLESFRDAYGEPTHLDGHHHVHLHPYVLEALPPDLLIRPPLRRPAAADHAPDPTERVLAGRGPRWAFALEHVHPDLGGTGQSALTRARGHAVEVMAHPGNKDQLDALLGPRWAEMLRGLRLGSYASLREGSTAALGAGAPEE